ncbi:MAG: translesion error-prone DNA polymerase V autoproteolytic subunit [Thermodesulfobacteriota bacterium]|nr:translesion error-prone DNA polymerase V autoproteolytic subunit [Thermodesulfobacteriota bacterium]
MKLKTGSSIAQIYGADIKTKVARPFFLCGISAGFPSPADDYIDRMLDLNELLINNPPATFFVRVAGESMVGAGINDGDILVVDRSLDPQNGKIVVAVVNGELTVKRLIKNNGEHKLVAENPKYPSLEVTDETQCEIWGTATSVIRQL